MEEMNYIKSGDGIDLYESPRTRWEDLTKNDAGLLGGISNWN